MSGIFESIWQTSMDVFKGGPNQLLEKKTGHPSNMMPQLAKVREYHPEDHSASVSVLGAGDGPPIRMKIKTNYQGKHPGTGEAIALFEDQLVKVVLGPEGIWNVGTIVGALYTNKDAQSPSHPIWKQKGSSAVKITLDEGSDGEGNVRVLDDQSNNYQVITGHEHKESLGSVSNVQAGPHVTYTEQKTKEMASSFSDLAGNIKV